MLENINIKQFYPGPILNKTLDITDFLFKDPEQVHITYTYKNEDGSLSNRELTYGTEYEVAKILPSDVTQADSVLTASTGRVTLKADINVSLGERLTIYRESEIVQEVQYPRTGPFPAASHEGALDYLTMQNQEQQDQIDRSLKVPISTANFDGALPIPVPARALKINNSGSGFELSEYDPDTALESTKEYMESAQTAASNALASQNAAASSASSAASSETVAIQQANIAIAKTAEITETYHNAMIDITANKERSMSAIDENRISSIEEISNTKTTTISDISTAGAEQVSNIKKTGFYMQNDKLYYINADGETKEFISGGGRELLEIYIDPFCDESENKGRIANGQIIIQSQFKDVTKKLKKRVGWDSENKKATLNTSLVCTEEEWQAIKIASKLGQCGKFVIDDEAGTIRLPAIININGLTDLSKAGLIKDESLPNIRGMFVTATSGEILTANGCIKSVKEITDANVRTRGAGTFGFRSFKMNVDASGSSSTYQDNAPVQQEAVQYPYVICVNTGVEEAERPINNYQVNNTNSYGDSKYVGGMTLNNASWLKSEGQANSGTIYTGFYNWAVANIGQPFGAGLIKESTATDITDYDLVVDQANQTFILPTLNGSEDLPSDKYDNLTLGASNEKHIAPANGWIVLSKISNTSPKFVNAYTDNGRMVEMMSSFNGQQVKCSFFVHKGEKYIISYNADGDTLLYRFIYAKGNGNLYYYVGDTLQNLDLINIARMQEELVNKVDKKQATQASMPSGKYIDLTLGASGTPYTAPADGYFCVTAYSNNENGFHSIDLFYNQTVDYTKPFIRWQIASQTAYGGGLALVKKGQNVCIGYSRIDLLKSQLKFIYAVGSNPSA